MFQLIITFLIMVCLRGESLLNYKLSEGSKRKLEETKPTITSQSWEPLRIHYEFLKTTFDEKSTKFLSEVLDITSLFFQKHLLIQRTSEKLTYKSDYPDKIYGFIINDELQSKEYDADLVLFINVEYSSDYSYMAYCGPFVFDIVLLGQLSSYQIQYFRMQSIKQKFYLKFIIFNSI